MKLFYNLCLLFSFSPLAIASIDVNKFDGFAKIDINLNKQNESEACHQVSCPEEHATTIALTAETLIKSVHENQGKKSLKTFDK